MQRRQLSNRAKNSSLSVSLQFCIDPKSAQSIAIEYSDYFGRDSRSLGSILITTRKHFEPRNEGLSITKFRRRNHAIEKQRTSSTVKHQPLFMTEAAAQDIRFRLRAFGSCLVSSALPQSLRNQIGRNFDCSRILFTT